MQASRDWSSEANDVSKAARSTENEVAKALAKANKDLPSEASAGRMVGMGEVLNGVGCQITVQPKTFFAAIRSRQTD